MTSPISAYKNIQAYVQRFQNQASSALPNANTNKTHDSFSNVLSKMSDNLLKDVRGLEQSMKELSMGNISPEDVIVQVKSVTLEAEGAMAVVKTGTESLKQIISIQV